ncbi:hypothetical protein [Desulfosarcina variabilis]|uniref:hypothetical protein n=1 Tax=Desulfosarcina variabilis TaxID=2300 RepID=UPI003AFAB945
MNRLKKFALLPVNKIRVGLMMTPITTALVVEADKLAVQQQALLDEAEKRAADALDGIAKEKK